MSDARDDLTALSLELARHLRDRPRRAAMNYGVNFTELADLLDHVQPFIPRFEASFAEPRDGGGQPATVLAALRAAVQAVPDEWFLRLMLSYYLLIETHDEEGAADQLRQAGSHQGAPFYVRSLAQRLGAQLHQPDPLPPPRLSEVTARIKARVDAFREQRLRWPTSLEEALSDAEGAQLRTQLEVELVVGPDGQVVTRERTIREQLALQRASSFRRVKPFVIPER
jgi:hypothetical protein